MAAPITPFAAPDQSRQPLAQMRKQAEELEGVFLNMLTKQMFSSIDTGESAFGGGFAEETWRGIQAEQFAASMAAAGGIGLADSIMAQLIARQEANQPRPTTMPKGAYK
jgi:peptidoglycan hydrolase FlgJ